MDRRDFQSHLDHLVVMWKQAAFREHAEWEAERMKREWPELYRRMPEALKEVTDQLRIQASARRAASSPSTPDAPKADG